MQSSFKETQLNHVRVKTAYQKKEPVIKEYFKTIGKSYQGFTVFIRVFKREENLEVWIKEKNGDTFSLLHTYKFCSTSGTLGPKRKEGDLQIPEGVYEIIHFNPQSNFHLSVGINYPNTADKILGDRHPGGAIYIHGNCVTIGCIPITDDKIEELYVLAVEARNNGQEKIPVHIFPDRLKEGVIKNMVAEYAASKSTTQLWNELQPIYADFESGRKLKPISITGKGDYEIKK